MIFHFPPREKGNEVLEGEIEDDRFSSVELVQKNAVIRRDIEKFILTAPLGLYRAKWVLQLTDADGPELLQVVGRRWRWTPVIGKMARLIGSLVLVMEPDNKGVIAHFGRFFAGRSKGAVVENGPGVGKVVSPLNASSNEN